MHTTRQSVPWEYGQIVRCYLQPDHMVLDVGTGGGERFLALAPHFKVGIGVDNDPDMVAIACTNATASGMQHVSFHVDDHHLNQVPDGYDIILCRQAPFSAEAVYHHIKPQGYFIVQEVGERNMANIKAAIGQSMDQPTLTKTRCTYAGLKLIAFLEYDVEYIVQDVESLVFWLQALDRSHADLAGGALLHDAQVFNTLLHGNVDHRGFVTNEHRYLAIAQKP